MVKSMNRARWAAVISGLALGLAAGRFVAGSAETPRVAASRLAGMRSAGVSGFQIQNLSATQSSTITANTYYVQRGDDAAGRAPQSIRLPNVSAGAAGSAFLPQARQLHSGIYSALVWAYQPIGAIVRSDWGASGGAAIYSGVRLGPEVALPLAMIDYVGASSVVFVQNANPEEAETIHVELRASGSSTPVAEFDIDLDGGHAAMLDLARDPRFGEVVSNTEHGFLGAMTFRADGPIGVQSYVDYAPPSRAVLAFEGSPTDHASTTLYAPLIRKRFYGYDTGISVVNPNRTDTDVTVRYIGGSAGGASSCAGREIRHGPVTIKGGSSSVFYQGPGGGSGLPDGCLGSAIIEASRPVLAVVNDSLNFTEHSAAYNAVRAEDGGTAIALPLVRRRHVAAWMLTTGIQVMNLGTRTANVTITFVGERGEELTGCGFACQATIAPRGTWTFYPGGGGINVLPVGTFGSAVITSNEPIVALVNDASEIGAVDAATYVGIRMDRGEAVSNLCDPGRVGMACLALPSLFNAMDHRAP